MLTDQQLQSLRNMGNECEEAADEIERLRQIAEAASDYKLALADDEFANIEGGVDKVCDRMFALVDEWEAMLAATERSE